MGAFVLDVADTDVHTIAVFPEGQAPLGAKLCVTDAVARRCFQFGGNSPQGYASLSGTGVSLEGFLDKALSPTAQQIGGPYASLSACHFRYIPAASTIYLDTSSGQLTFPYSAVLDGNPTAELSNGACTIHIGQTNEVVARPNNITLNVDFGLSSGIWYQYELIQTPFGPLSGSNQDQNFGITPWSLWGYWQVP